MNEDGGGRILTEVHRLEDRLYAKIDDAKARLAAKIDNVEARLDSKIDFMHEHLLGRFEQLHATKHTHDRLSEKIDALQVEIVRNSRKRR